MPEHLRALVYILVVATVVFVFAKAPGCAMAMASKDFERRRNLWFALTFTAFLAHNFWICIAVAATLLAAAQRSEQNKLAMYFFVLFALPPLSANISGMGLINALFELNYVRLLSLAVLLPAYLTLRKDPATEPFCRSTPDRFIAGYMIFNAVLMFEYRTFTSILRDGVFYAFLDVFLPYYVASRLLRNLQEFRDALMSFAVAALVLSATLFLEFRGNWLLYASLEKALGAHVVGMEYLVRGANIRALATIGHSIVAGFVVAVALGFFLYLRKVVPNRIMWVLGVLLLIAGLIGPVSRGPWVGAAAIIVVFVATGPAPALGLAKLAMAGLIAIPVLLMTPPGATIIDHLPFVGTIDESNVIGRRILAEVSFQVFLENPVLGRYDFVETPAMQALRGSDGMVDVVNTYLVIALRSGLVGLLLFAGFFLTVILGIYTGMRNLADRNSEHYVLGQALIATLVGILLTIATFSPILLSPTIYWLVAGLGVAYARMFARGKISAVAGNPALQPTPK